MFNIAVFEITNVCNLDCSYCYENDKKKVRSLISPGNFAYFLAHHAGLYREVVLSGGEPFLHPSWIEFAAILREYGMKVNFITNGTGIKKIMENRIKVDGLVISLDSFSETFNLLRNSRVICSKEDILGLKGSGLVKDISLQIILNKLSANKENLNDILRFCELNKVGLKVKLMDTYKFNKTDSYMLDPDEVSQVRKYLSEQVKTRNIDMDISIPSIYGNAYNKCTLIRKCGNLRIRSDGKIFPCEKMNDNEYEVGVLSDSSEQIFANFKKVQTKLLVRIMKLSKNTCRECTQNVICEKGCPALCKTDDHIRICKKVTYGRHKTSI